MASPRRRRALKLARQQKNNPLPVQEVVVPVEVVEVELPVVEEVVTEKIVQEVEPVTVKQTYASVGRPRKNKATS
jgi:hypothetical protein